MKVKINAAETCTDIPEYMSTYEQDSKQNNEHLQAITTYIINAYTHTKSEIKHDIQPYWTFHDDLTGIDRRVLKVHSTLPITKTICRDFPSL